MEENVGLKGTFRVAVLGKPETYREVPNLVMNAGKAEVSGLILTDIGGNAFDYIAVGTDNTAPNATQSALLSEAYRSAGTGSQETTTVTDDTARLTTSISITASATIQEAGVFNSSSGGDILARSTFSGISVQNNDTLNVGYDTVVS
jgi:hypothetical protein